MDTKGIEQLLLFMGLNTEEVNKDKGSALKERLNSFKGNYKAKPNKLIRNATKSTFKFRLQIIS